MKVFEQVLERNNVQIREILRKIENRLKNIDNSTITIWGLSFKAGTDDIRNSSSIRLIEELSKRNAEIKIFDPVAKIDSSIFRNLEVYQDPYLSVHNSDMLIIMTEWNLFLEFDYSKVFKVMNNKNVVDARNILDNSLLKTLGFNYTGIGVT